MSAYGGNRVSIGVMLYSAMEVPRLSATEFEQQIYILPKWKSDSDGNPVFSNETEAIIYFNNTLIALNDLNCRAASSPFKVNIEDSRGISIPRLAVLIESRRSLD